MRVCFLSERPALLTVGGLPLGTADGFERTAELDPKANLLCELKAEGRLPVTFFFNEDFLLSPPPQIELYYYRDGLAVFAHSYLRADASLHVLWQRRERGILFTLYTQGTTTLCLSSGGVHLIALPDEFEESELFPAGDLFLLEAPSSFVLFTKEGEVLVRSDGKVLERGATVKAEVPYRDSLGHSALVEYENGVLVNCTIRAARTPTAATYALALFESARLGADCRPYLSEELLEKADSLPEYLGKFTSAVLAGEDEVGLVYKRRERVFDVRYFRVEKRDGKVSNITPCP